MSPADGELRLAALCGLIEALSRIKDRKPDQIGKRVAQVLRAALGAEAATYYDFLPQKGHLVPRYAAGPRAADLKETPVDIRTGLCGWTARHRKPLLIADAYHDERFLREVDGVTGFRTKSVLVVPMFNRSQLIGVIQLLNKSDGAFDRKDLRYALAACSTAELALQAVNQT